LVSAGLFSGFKRASPPGYRVGWRAANLLQARLTGAALLCQNTRQFAGAFFTYTCECRKFWRPGSAGQLRCCWPRTWHKLGVGVAERL
jgi:hypothetical protein